MVVPDRLLAFAEAIGALISDSPTGWSANLDLVGCWPIPPGAVSFGKGSSCVVGAEIAVSCTEVELTVRARNAGWEGGWISTFNPDSRFPSGWRRALISKTEAIRILRSEFPRATEATAGIPDLVFKSDGRVVAAECKRLRGRYRNNDCEWRTGGDAFRPSQDSWAAAAIANGVSSEALLAVWWNRVDAANCG